MASKREVDRPVSGTTLAVGVGVTLAAVLGFYFVKFWGTPFGKPDAFGQFGDYVGGIMNPIVAIFALWMLVRQLHLTSKELAMSRAEMAASSAALERQAIALERRELREDLGRTIAALEARLDHLVDAEIEISSPDKPQHTQKSAYSEFSLSEFKIAKIAGTKKSSRWFNQFTRTVDELGKALQAYDQVSPAKHYTGHIRQRFYTDLENAVMNGWISEAMWQVFNDVAGDNAKASPDPEGLPTGN